jgi:hypothetical protein
MKEMEALFDQLRDDNGEYGYSVKWKTMYIHDEKNWVYVVDPAKDTFEIDEFTISWYHAANHKHPDTPVVLISYQSDYRAPDSWVDNEDEVDATAEDIASFIKNIRGGFENDRGVPDRLEEIG